MAQRPDLFAPDEWYHCFNRGVDKRVIYTSSEDYERFLSLLYACNSKESIHVSNLRQGKTLVDLIASQSRGTPLVSIGAYCLMPNHFHVLLREHDYGGITSFMRRLGTGYTMYFNLKYDRVGALFQGAFKSRRINTDQYFNRAVSYIHANPAELIEPEWKSGDIVDVAHVEDFLTAYKYSSFPDFISERPESGLIDKESVNELLETKQSFARLLEEARIYSHHNAPR